MKQICMILVLAMATSAWGQTVTNPIFAPVLDSSNLPVISGTNTFDAGLADSGNKFSLVQHRLNIAKKCLDLRQLSGAIDMVIAAIEESEHSKAANMLVVLSTNCVIFMETNSVHQSCEEAGCTNWYWGEISEQIKPAEYCPEHSHNFFVSTNAFVDSTLMLDKINICTNCKPAIHEKRKVKMCVYMHGKSIVFPVCERSETIIGANGTPLFKVIKQRALSRPEHLMMIENTWYRTGTFIVDIDDKL